jgi:hypothetical protein
MFNLEDSFSKLSPTYDALVPTNVPHPWLKVTIASLMALSAAELLYRTVERPLNRLGHHLSNPERPPYVFPTAGKVLAAFGGAIATILIFHHPILAAIGPRNVARDKRVTMSSQEPGHPRADALVNGSLETGFAPETTKEKAPWMLIDLGAETRIGAIRVYNRSDGWEEEQIPLVASYSNDGVVFNDLAQRKTMFTQDLPWRISGRNRRARYVRLMSLSRRETPLSLSEVEIFESPIMAQIP